VLANSLFRVCTLNALKGYRVSQKENLTWDKIIENVEWSPRGKNGITLVKSRQLNQISLFDNDYLVMLDFL
jgi:hypothetical protein